MPPTPIPATRRAKCYEALTVDQAINLTNAFQFSEATSRPLNAQLNINWDQLRDLSPADCHQGQGVFLKAMAQWLVRHDHPTAFLWVNENSREKGTHTHLMLHLQGSLKDRKETMLALRGYLNAKFGAINRRITQADGRVTWANAIDAKWAMDTEAQRQGALRYRLKGLDQTADWQGVRIAEALGIEDRGPQGIITSKRCGLSQMISEKARAAGGWAEIRNLTGLHRCLHPLAPFGDASEDF